MRELRRKTGTVIEELNWPRKQGDEQAVLYNMVLTYLVHHGYSQTAESFARSVGQEISEELNSMRNRQQIQKLVMVGKIGEAINLVDHLYPGLLSINQDLHFKLKVSFFQILLYEFFQYFCINFALYFCMNFAKYFCSIFSKYFCSIFSKYFCLIFSKYFCA